MPGSPSEVFAAALQAVSRSAAESWARANPSGPDYRLTKHLDHPTLIAVALGVLPKACGPQLSPESPFRITLYSGKFDTEDGKRVDCTLGQFANWLTELGKEVAAKGEGMVAPPITSRDGRRTNESTVFMHAINLDADGRGNWTQILSRLKAFRMAHIAYQSGGWTPTTPKWHLVLPLSRPFDVSDESKQAAWKRFYNLVRVVVGSLADLTGEGFDPACETPCQPVFVTERRSAEDPPREVVAYLEGHSFDADAFLKSVPAPPFAEIRRTPPPTSHRSANPTKREEIIEALCAVMEEIFSDRRELYLALAGALLDRGCPPEDVRDIIAEVSERCPGDPSYTEAEIESRHREHIHAANTTISRWRKGATYLRIGTIAERWPEVAQAIDRALPHPFAVHARELMGLGGKPVEPQKQATSAKIASEAIDPQAVLVSEIRKRIMSYRQAKMKSDDLDDIARAILMKRLLAGDTLLEPSDPEPLQMPMASAIAKIAGALAFVLPKKTPIDAVIIVAFRSLQKVGDFEGDAVRFFESGYERSLAARLEQEAAVLTARRTRKREEISEQLRRQQAG